METLDDQYAQVIAARLRRHARPGRNFYVQPALLQAGKVEVKLSELGYAVVVDAVEFLKWLDRPEMSWERITGALVRKHNEIRKKRP